MEEYEIRDVSNRHTAPALDIELVFRPGGTETNLTEGTSNYYAPVGISMAITTHNAAIAEYAVVHLYVDSRIQLGPLDHDVKLYTDMDTVVFEGNTITLRKLATLWDRSRGLPIFSGMTAELPAAPLKLSIPKDVEILAFRYIIGSPSMTARDERIFMEVHKNNARFIRPSLKHSPEPKSAA